MEARDTRGPERRRLIGGAAGVLLSLVLAPMALADARAGAVVFKRDCAVCHSVRRGEIVAGPSLAGLMGRPAGTVAAFPYSAAMKGSGVVWTAATLETFLASPRKMIPRINMASSGAPDPAQRADLISYLATLK